MELINKRYLPYNRESSKKVALKLFRWRNLPRIERQVTYMNVARLEVNIISIVNDENKIGIREIKLQPRKTFNSVFLESKCTAAIFLYKDTGKVWTINHRAMVQQLTGNQEILKTLGFEWAYKLPGYLFTKPVIRAVMRGLCTNRNDAIRRYYSSLGLKGVNYRIIKALGHVTECGEGNRLYETHMRVATNLENLVRYKLNEHLYNQEMVTDLAHLAQMLDKKVNFNWSPKRMKLEHDKMSKEVSGILLKYQEHKEVNYEAIAPVPQVENLTLLKSNSELLEESVKMAHCVGTSPVYFEYMQIFTNLIFHYERNGIEGTAQIRIDEKDVTLQQFYGIGNKPLPMEEKDILRASLTSPEFIEFVDKIREYKGQQVASGELVDETDDLPF